MEVQDGSENVNCDASKSFSKAHSGYSTMKRQLLAFVNFSRHFNHYLLERKFQIVTDHRALQWFHNFKDPDGSTARWLGKLAAFENEKVHRSGKSNRHADFRILCPGFPVKTPPWLRGMNLSAVWKQSRKRQLRTKQVAQNALTVLELANTRTTLTPHRAKEGKNAATASLDVRL